jgi:hypothetical protein
MPKDNAAFSKKAESTDEKHDIVGTATIPPVKDTWHRSAGNSKLAAMTSANMPAPNPAWQNRQADLHTAMPITATEPRSVISAT